jgi:L-idonate 5-dehydrogenase
MAEYVMVRADQCHILPTGMDDGFGAMIEPLAVALHAVKRVGSIGGKKVLVTGGGTIGLLTALAAKSFGAVPVVVSDLVRERREFALKIGIDAVLDPAEKLADDKAKEIVGAGFEIVFEASGAPPALQQAFQLITPGGTIVQIGTIASKEVALPANQIMAKELQVIGSFRYGNVFDEAIKLVISGRLDLTSFITNVLPLNAFNAAMNLAADKVHALKVQLEV